MRYLAAYTAVAGDLPGDRATHVHAVLDEAERQWAAATADGAVPDQAAYNAVKEQFGKVTVEAQAMCREVWATFNVETMMVGVAVLVGSVVAVLLLLFKPLLLVVCSSNVVCIASRTDHLQLDPHKVGPQHFCNSVMLHLH